MFLNIDDLGLDSNEGTGEIAVTLGLTTYARS